MDMDVVEQIEWLAILLPRGLYVAVAVHFFILPTAFRVWDMFNPDP